MRIAASPDVLAQAIQTLALSGLSELRAGAILPDQAIWSIKEQKNAGNRTWYLSILRSKRSDEVSVSIGIQLAPEGQSELSADVCYGARIILDAKSTDSPEPLTLEGARLTLNAFFREAPSALAEALNALLAEPD
jgi:hypothetical protein